jgi:hypothetical protein
MNLRGADRFEERVLDGYGYLVAKQTSETAASHSDYGFEWA